MSVWFPEPWGLASGDFNPGGTPGFRLKVKGPNDPEWRKFIESRHNHLIERALLYLLEEEQKAERDQWATYGEVLLLMIEDWEGIVDDNGEPIPFSVEAAGENLFKDDDVQLPAEFANPRYDAHKPWSVTFSHNGKRFTFESAEELLANFPDEWAVELTQDDREDILDLYEGSSLKFPMVESNCTVAHEAPVMPVPYGGLSTREAIARWVVKCITNTASDG